MINELKVIADGLDKIGEGVEQIHGNIFTPGGKEALRVLLGDNATLDSIEYMDGKKLNQTWGLKTSNQDQFPCIKLTIPLRLSGNLFYSSYFSFLGSKNNQEVRNSFLEQCNNAEILFEKFINFDKQNKIKFLLEKYPSEDINISSWPKNTYRQSILDRFESLKVSNDEEVQIITEVYRRYSLFGNNGIDFLANLDKKIQDNLCSDSLNIQIDLLLNILFGEKKVTNKGEISGDSRSILFLDYIPNNYIDEFAFTSLRKTRISKFLNENAMSDNLGISDLSGEKIVIISDKYPERNLGKGKPVSLVRLYSKFDNAGGQTTVRRYNKSGTDAYHLGVNEGSWLAESLVKLTKDEYKGKTWDTIPSEKVKKNDLLIAFCKSPNVAITPMFTGSDIEDIDDYLNVTQDVIRNFKKSNLTLQGDIVDFIVLRKINDGNQKVVYSKTRSIGALQKAAKEWIEACQNVPNVFLKIKIGTNNRYSNAWVVPPITLISMTGKKYIRDGRVAIDIPAESFSSIMDLFFSYTTRMRQLAFHCLNKLTNQYEPLFSLCALSKLQSVVKNAPMKANLIDNRSALEAVTCCTALLYKLGRGKEDYMKGFAFQLGQLCSAMDQLHIGYCEDMRGGQIPNALIGNSTYNIALQNPVKALALLASRIKPYAGWAIRQWNKKTKTEDRAIKNGMFAYKWLSGQSEILEEHLNKNEEMINDSYKAELMLGYLTGRPFGESERRNAIEGEEK